jgi:hypothetical protein
MNLENLLQAKLKELETMRSKLQEMEQQKQQLVQAALEVQGAAKQLVELINEEKAAKETEKPAA